MIKVNLGRRIWESEFHTLEALLLKAGPPMEVREREKFPFSQSVGLGKLCTESGLGFHRSPPRTLPSFYVYSYLL